MEIGQRGVLMTTAPPVLAEEANTAGDGPLNGTNAAFACRRRTVQIANTSFALQGKAGNHSQTKVLMVCTSRPLPAAVVNGEPHVKSWWTQVPCHH